MPTGRTCWRSVSPTAPMSRAVAHGIEQAVGAKHVVLTGDDRGKAEFLDSVRRQPAPDRDQRVAGRHRPLRGSAGAGRHDHPLRAAAPARDRAAPGRRCPTAAGASPPRAGDAHGDPARRRRRRLAGLLAGRRACRRHAREGPAAGHFRGDGGSLAARRRGGSRAAGQPGGGVPRRPQGGQGPSRRSPDGGNQRTSRHRVAPCAGRAAGCRRHGRARPGRRLRPRLDRAGPGACHADGGDPHRRPLRAPAGLRWRARGGAADRPSSRGQRLPRGREREVTGAAGLLGGDPAGADCRGGVHDPVPAVHAR